YGVIGILGVCARDGGCRERADAGRKQMTASHVMTPCRSVVVCSGLLNGSIAAILDQAVDTRTSNRIAPRLQHLRLTRQSDAVTRPPCHRSAGCDRWRACAARSRRTDFPRPRFAQQESIV